MSKRKSQSEHDSMVESVANYLVSQNYRNVKADLKGWDEPKEIKWKGSENGHIPDVTGEKENDHNILVEVETADSIFDQHTEDQWKLFSAFAGLKSYEFWVIVPEESVDNAEKRADNLDVEATVFYLTDE